MAKLVIAGLLIAFVLFYVMTSPDQAAQIATGGWDGLVDIAHGVGRFLNKLVD